MVATANFIIQLLQSKLFAAIFKLTSLLLVLPAVKKWQINEWKPIPMRLWAKRMQGCAFLPVFACFSNFQRLLFPVWETDRLWLWLVSWWQNQWVGALDTERQSVFVLSAIVNRVPQHLYFRHLRVCISQIFPFVFLQTLAQYLLHSTAVTLHSLSPQVSADKQSFPLNFVF